ncbi:MULTISPECIES: molybdate ABC transporter substrate-binding protein [unclassified Nitratiruptor]|uniref:molybdate ABC transporter substrate-binding protein n=1 Tax=unclassified Nitratiruptor TaxID=2624044 RepID=UPI001F48181E|nr:MULTISPECIES: molybdate ABC transporter substrate-binding protein [unclassified Nitratiruptor]
MKKIVLLFAFLTALLAKEQLLIFAGSASKPATEEAAKAFEKKTGVHIDIIFGGSGFVLSQMQLTKQGDLYFPGSSDYMEIAKKKGLVNPKSEKIVVYLVSAINVQKGNPKHIHSLKDLTKPGIKVAIANPQGVCVGAYAIEILEKNFTPEQKKQFRNNLVGYTGSCAKTANAIALKQADAVIGWRVFHYWNPKKIETIPLKPSEIVRIGYIPIAISKYSRHPKLAQKFIDFLTSQEGQKIFAKYHYFATIKQAQQYIGAKKPVGGKYKVPQEWMQR